LQAPKLPAQPVNVVRVAIGVPPGQPLIPPTLGFRVIGPNGVRVTVTLSAGTRVRVTDVMNLDEHAEEPLPPFRETQVGVPPDT
jgi:hypothetical protein